MNRVVWYVLLVFELWNVQNILGGNILGIFPTRNKDDFLIGEAVVKGLLGNGHTITVLSHFPQQLPVANYKDINLSDCELKLDVNNEDVPYLANERIHREFLAENSTCSCVLAGCDYSELEEFDLLVVGMEYHSCFLHIGNPLNVPIIWVVSSNQNLLANSLTGDLDPLHPVLKSKWYRRLMEFLDRMKSFGNYLSKILYYWQIRSYMTTVNRDLFVNVNTELVEKVDFVFYNTHFSIFPRPHVPNVIEIAGIHIEEEGAICPRVQQFMEDAENGVIFISTPTDEPSKRMFDEKMQTFEISFLRVAQSILWKRSAALRIPNYNLFRSDRLPQRQILNHENVIVFIGCASLNNIYEAVSSATPMIGICCLPEQLDDMTRLEELGVGIALPYHSVNEVTVVNAVNLIWQDKSYARKMQKLSSAFNDRTMTPLNTAVYWAEYAIRHNGGSHLKSQASKMPLYSYLMLDFGPLSFIIGILYCYFGMLLYIKLYYWLKPKVLRYFKR